MQAAASIALLLMSVSTQPGMAQQTTPQTQTQTSPTAPAPPQGVVSDTTGTPGLPQAPAPKPTEPLYLRDTPTDYTQPKSHFWNPIAPYTATDVPAGDDAEYSPAGLAAAGWQDLSEPVGCGDAGA